VNPAPSLLVAAALYGAFQLALAGVRAAIVVSGGASAATSRPLSTARPSLSPPILVLPQPRLLLRTLLLAALLGGLAVALGAPLSSRTAAWLAFQASATALPLAISTSEEEASASPPPRPLLSGLLSAPLALLLDSDSFEAHAPSLLPAVASGIGAWLGCLVVPLDWGTDWQVFPVGSAYMGAGGLVAGHIVAAVVGLLGGGGRRRGRRGEDKRL
jgi:hypothetical protein